MDKKKNACLTSERDFARSPSDAHTRTGRIGRIDRDRCAHENPPIIRESAFKQRWIERKLCATFHLFRFASTETDAKTLKIIYGSMMAGSDQSHRAENVTFSLPNWTGGICSLSEKMVGKVKTDFPVFVFFFCFRRRFYSKIRLILGIFQSQTRRFRHFSRTITFQSKDFLFWKMHHLATNKPRCLITQPHWTYSRRWPFFFVWPKRFSARTKHRWLWLKPIRWVGSAKGRTGAVMWLACGQNNRSEELIKRVLDSHPVGKFWCVWKSYEPVRYTLNFWER